MKTDKTKSSMHNKFDNIEYLYDTYSKRLYFTSFRITGSKYDAEEVMQDAFIKYYNYSDKSSINNIESWLVSICIRQSIDIVRKKKRDKNLIDQYASIEEDNTTDIYGRTQEIKIKMSKDLTVENIKKAVISLPEIFRIIISLHLIEGYDYEEIAQITGLNQNTIRSRYLRGKEKLAESLKLI